MKMQPYTAAQQINAEWIWRSSADSLYSTFFYRGYFSTIVAILNVWNTQSRLRGKNTVINLHFRLIIFKNINVVRPLLRPPLPLKKIAQS